MFPSSYMTNVYKDGNTISIFLKSTIMKKNNCKKIAKIGKWDRDVFANECSRRYLAGEGYLDKIFPENTDRSPQRLEH